MRKLESTGIESSTVNRYLAALKTILKNFRQQTDFIRLRKENNGRIRVLSRDEEARAVGLLRGAEGKKPYYIEAGDMVEVLVDMRQGEILSICWKDVDFDRKRIVLLDTKNGSNRQVPLAGAAEEELKKILSGKKSAKIQSLKPIGDDLVFHNGTGGLLNIRTSWDHAVKIANLDSHFRFHDLRHTAASYLAMNGATLLELSQILGHKTLSMVKRYAHLTEQHLHNVVERMNTAFLPVQSKG